jgi:hypothetical protein
MWTTRCDEALDNTNVLGTEFGPGEELDLTRRLQVVIAQPRE